MPSPSSGDALLLAIALEWRLLDQAQLQEARRTESAIWQFLDESDTEDLLLEKEWRARRPPLLEQYPIVKYVGSGTAARVYQVKDGKGLAALKILKASIAPVEIPRKRFERETRILSQMRHVNVVSLLGSGVSLERPYLLMPWIEGTSLERLLEKRIHDQKTLLGYVLDVAAGVEYAHQQGVIHRDLKPANVLVTDQGRAKILDFGLATFVDPTTVLTAPGRTLGTLLYLAPEQALARRDLISTRTDVYQLGAILYHVLAGTPPHGDSGITRRRQWLECVRDREPTPPRKLATDVPAPLEEVALRALRKDPSERFDSAAAFGGALQDALAPARPATAAAARTTTAGRKARATAERAIVTLFVQREGALAPVRHAFPLEQGKPFVLGRGKDADLRPTVVDRRVSRRHCALEWRGRELVAMNESPNGTLVNGSPIGQDGAALEPGDVLSVADVSIEVRFSPLERTSDDALVGTAHSGYVFEALLSTTESGAVYRAVHREILRPVQIHVFWATRKDEVAAKMFSRMIRIARTLTHPNLVQVFDCGRTEQGGYPFAVMELFEGRTLEERLAAGPPALDVGLDWVLQIASALAFAHARRIVHRDVQPANVLVDDDGLVKLAGLGLAKSIDPAEEVSLTAPSESRGNPAYAAPEQLADARKAGPPADVYALGAILSHVLTGRPSKREGPPVDARVPEGLSAIATRAMARRPAERFPSVAAMAEAIRDYRHPASWRGEAVADAKRHFLAMLPQSPEIPGFEVAVSFESAEQVGGDFYDIFPVGDRRYGVLIGDVAGHGVPAALLVGMAKTSGRIFARQANGPAEALAAVHEELGPMLPDGVFITMSLLVIDLDEATVSYARGGHHALHVFNRRREPVAKRYEPPGMAIGMLPSRRFVQEECHFHLEAGDLLLLYTDGVVEAMTPAGELYTLDRLLEAIEANLEEPLGRLLQGIDCDVRGWMGGTGVQDDRTLVALRYGEGEGRP